MLTMTLNCDVSDNHTVVLQLPKSVPPGQHRIKLVIDRTEHEGKQDGLSPVTEDAPPRTELWQRLEALRAEARQCGDLPCPMSWDAILDEVHRRRGEYDG